MIKDLTRGGQTFLHTYHMIMKIAYVLILWFIAIFIITNVVWIYFETNRYDYYLLSKLSEAMVRIMGGYFYRAFGFSDLAQSIQPMFFQSVNGQSLTIVAGNFLVNPDTSKIIYHLKEILYEGSVISVISGFVVVLLIGFFLNKRGSKLGQETHLRGAMVSTAEQLKKKLLENNYASDIRLSNVPIIKDSEIQHILITGSVGTGKTVCISEILAQVRQKKQRAIVYDKMGVYTQRFYRPEKDILLNPLDKRCPRWNIWAECRNAADYDTLAESLMPMPTQGQDPFWIMAARIVFAVAARRLKHRGETSTASLLRYLLMADLNRIQELIANTEAESLASEKAEKMALSVKAILSTYLKSLRYLTEGIQPFSIREWIANESDDSWIFITSRGDQHATLRPLISTWLDIAANAMMSLSRSRTRRIWLPLDEVDSLQGMPSVPDFLTQARQFGGCGIVSVQAISQFYKNFGQDIAETIIGACNTGIHFRSPDKKTSDYVAELLGEKEIEEMNENISYGANAAKNSVSLSQHHNIKRIVLPSQLRQLDDLEAYLRLKGDWPIAKIKFTYRDYSESQLSFEPREIDVDTSLENMMKQIQEEVHKQGLLLSTKKQNSYYQDNKSASLPIKSENLKLKSSKRKDMLEI